MKNFKQYLFESEFHDDGISIKHTHHIDGNQIDTFFEGGGNKKYYDVHFTVNGKLDHKKNSNTHTNTKILYHITKTMHKFINYKKPNYIKLTAYDKNKKKEIEKQKFYDKLGAHIAKKHNGNFSNSTIKLEH